MRWMAVTGLLLLTGCQSNPQHSQWRSDYDPMRYANTPVAINTSLGVGYLQQGNNELALARLQRALKLDDSYAPAHGAIALLYDRLGDPVKAGEHYARSVSLDPVDAGSHNNYGWWLCRQERFDEAQREFDAAVANPLYRTPALAYTNAGICARRAGDDARGEANLRKALGVDGNFSNALLEMAHLSADKGNFLQGRAFLQRYLNGAEHSAETLLLGVVIERGLGNRDAVASYSLSLERNFPDSPETAELKKLMRQ